MGSNPIYTLVGDERIMGGYAYVEKFTNRETSRVYK